MWYLRIPSSNILDIRTWATVHLQWPKNATEQWRNSFYKPLVVTSEKIDTHFHSNGLKNPAIKLALYVASLIFPTATHRYRMRGTGSIMRCIIHGMCRMSIASFGVCLSLYDAVETVLKMQRDIETGNERALGWRLEWVFIPGSCINSVYFNLWISFALTTMGL